MRYTSLALTLCLGLGCQQKNTPSPKQEPSKVQLVTRPTLGEPPAVEPRTEAAEPQEQIAPKPAKGPVIASMFVGAFYRAFLDNELAADTKYKGKWVQLEGQVGEVRKDSRGKYYAGFGVYEGVDKAHLVAFLSEKGQKDFAGVKPLDTVKIVGKVAGAIKASGTHDGFQLLLEDCEMP